MPSQRLFRTQAHAPPSDCLSAEDILPLPPLSPFFLMDSPRFVSRGTALLRFSLFRSCCVPFFFFSLSHPSTTLLCVGSSCFLPRIVCPFLFFCLYPRLFGIFVPRLCIDCPLFAAVPPQYSFSFPPDLQIVLFAPLSSSPHVRLYCPILVEKTGFSSCWFCMLVLLFLGSFCAGALFRSYPPSFGTLSTFQYPVVAKRIFLHRAFLL